MVGITGALALGNLVSPVPSLTSCPAWTLQSAVPVQPELLRPPDQSAAYISALDVTPEAKAPVEVAAVGAGAAVVTPGWLAVAVWETLLAIGVAMPPPPAIPGAVGEAFAAPRTPLPTTTIAARNRTTSRPPTSTPLRTCEGPS